MIGFLSDISGVPPYDPFSESLQSELEASDSGYSCGVMSIDSARKTNERLEKSG